MLVHISTACSSCLMTNLSYQLLCGRSHWVFRAKKKKKMFDVIYVTVMRFLSSCVTDFHHAATGARERKLDQSLH